MVVLYPKAWHVYLSRMNNFDFYTFAEEMARSLRGIGHSDSRCRFFKANGSDEYSSLDERLSSVGSTVLIAVNRGDSDTQRNGADHIEERCGYVIIIASPTNDSQPDSRITAVTAADAMLKQIRNVLLRRYGNRLVQAKIYPGDVIADNFFGKALEFVMTEYPSFAVDSNFFLNDEQASGTVYS